jgi:hypothetical protein
MANNYAIMDLTLHGGGQGFESPRLHSKNVDIRRKSVVRQRVSVLTPTMYTHPQREDGIPFGGKD